MLVGERSLKACAPHWAQKFASGSPIVLPHSMHIFLRTLWGEWSRPLVCEPYTKPTTVSTRQTQVVDSAIVQGNNQHVRYCQTKATCNWVIPTSTLKSSTVIYEGAFSLNSQCETIQLPWLSNTPSGCDASSFVDSDSLQ